MKLCYTTSLNTGQGPNRPSGSLGGYISELPLKNDEFDNLFGEVSIYGAANGKTEYRALVLVNDGEKAAEDVKLWVSTDGESNFGDILIAPVAMNEDSEGRPVMERIADIYSKPFVGDFSQPSESDPINIGIMPAGMAIGIWVCRKINKDNIKESYNDLAKPLEYKHYWFEPVPKETDESWQLNVSWN